MDKSIRYLKGVGEKRAQCFEKMGIYTVSQLTRLLPRRYEDLGNVIDISELVAHRGEKVSILATVSLPVKETRIKGGNTLTTVYAEDLSGTARIVYFNNRFIKNMIKQYFPFTLLFRGLILNLCEKRCLKPYNRPSLPSHCPSG